MRGRGREIESQAVGQEGEEGVGKPPPWRLGASEEKEKRMKKERKNRRFFARGRLYTP